MTNVVIADDSAFLRKVLKDRLESSGKFRVIGAANNGREAIGMVKSLRPDILILDCEMPVMDGLECLKRIMAECALPVFMFSALTYEGAGITIQALENGAVDFLQKPASGVQGIDEVVQSLIIKIKVIISRERLKKISAKNRILSSGEASSLTELDKKSRPIDLVAMGSSTGGVPAAKNIIPNLPKDMKPIVWVQHMPPEFTKSFANRMNSLSKMHVKEAENGDVLSAGTCYLAPGGYQMRVEKAGNTYRLKIDGQERISGHCPSCDVLFESVANHFSSNAVGVILTGMGGDGAKGLVKMHNKGAYVIGQNKETCAVYGMPKVSYQAGAVDVELNLYTIAEGIMRLGRFIVP